MLRGREGKEVGKRGFDDRGWDSQRSTGGYLAIRKNEREGGRRAGDLTLNRILP